MHARPLWQLPRRTPSPRPRAPHPGGRPPAAPLSGIAGAGAHPRRRRGSLLRRPGVALRREQSSRRAPCRDRPDIASLCSRRGGDNACSAEQEQQRREALVGQAHTQVGSKGTASVKIPNTTAPHVAAAGSAAARCQAHASARRRWLLLLASPLPSRNDTPLGPEREGDGWGRAAAFHSIRSASSRAKPSRSSATH